MAPGELTVARPGIAGWSAARRMSLLIAVGIGLHNGTEGFGMVASLAADGRRAVLGFPSADGPDRRRPHPVL